MASCMIAPTAVVAGRAFFLVAADETVVCSATPYCACVMENDALLLMFDRKCHPVRMRESSVFLGNRVEYQTITSFFSLSVRPFGF